MNQAWTIPSMAPPPVPELGWGLVFQCLSTKGPMPVLAFAMMPQSYQRRPLKTLFKFSF